ncbi:unnamed protein product, partial [marine sediment metagenome]
MSAVTKQLAQKMSRKKRSNGVYIVRYNKLYIGMVEKIWNFKDEFRAERAGHVLGKYSSLEGAVRCVVRRFEKVGPIGEVDQ